MSDGAFSEKPLPRRCPYCGETIPAGSDMCWLCREKYAVREGEPPLQRVPHPEAAKAGYQYASLVFVPIFTFLWWSDGGVRTFRSDTAALQLD